MWLPLKMRENKTRQTFCIGSETGRGSPAGSEPVGHWDTGKTLAAHRRAQLGSAQGQGASQVAVQWGTPAP